jgi:hypothetical protein
MATDLRARRHRLAGRILLGLSAILATTILGLLEAHGPGAAAPAQAAPPPQQARDGWKDCAYNDVTIGCVDAPLADGIRIVWKDGLWMTYRKVPPRRTGDPTYLRDRLGGLWRRQVLAQGNTVLTNIQGGARIFIPLRFPCRPPLKGEVGYCHE